MGMGDGRHTVMCCDPFSTDQSLELATNDESRASHARRQLYFDMVDGTQLGHI